MTLSEWTNLCFSATVLFGIDSAQVTKELLENNPPLTPDSATRLQAAEILGKNHLGAMKDIISALEKRGLL